MTLVDSILEQGLHQFKSVSVTPKYPDYFKPLHSSSVYTYEQFKKLTPENIEELTNIRQEAISVAKNNKHHNSRLLTTFRAQIADMMRLFDVNVCKRNRDIDAMYAHYEKMIDDIITANELSDTVSSTYTLRVYYNDTTYTATGSNLSQCYSDIDLQIKQVQDKYNRQRKRLIEGLTYFISNGISVDSYNSDDELLDAVKHEQQRAAILQAYPPGTESTYRRSFVDHTCVHGEEFTADGELRIGYGVSGQYPRIRVNMLCIPIHFDFPDDVEIHLYPTLPTNTTLA